MNKREKILAIAVGAGAGAFILYMIVSHLVLAPAAELDVQAANLVRDIGKLTLDTSKYGAYCKRLQQYANLTLGTNELLADQQVSEKLVHLVQRSGLDPRNLDIKSSNIVRKRDLYREINRTVIVQGKLEELVNFLYLVKCDPHLHRLSNVSIVPRLKQGQAELQLRYSTLVLESRPGELTATSGPSTTQPAGDLNGEERAKYGLIALRDVFRPYIPKPEAPPPARTVAEVRPAEAPREAPRVERRPRLRVVDLTCYFGAPEVGVMDSGTQQTRRFKVGEQLGGGTIVMIDYRLVPIPRNPGSPLGRDNPEILSPSRVILQFEREYWAVELGCNIDDRRRLKTEDLPEELRQEQPTTAPTAEATQVGRVNG